MLGYSVKDIYSEVDIKSDEEEQRNIVQSKPKKKHKKSTSNIVTFDVETAEVIAADPASWPTNNFSTYLFVLFVLPPEYLSRYILTSY